MHMNSAPHLLSEDRPEFERILDEALRTAHERPELSGIGERLNAVQLRTMVLSAGTFVTDRAAAEYEYYVTTREELRAHAAAGAHESALISGGALEPAGAGAGAVVAVLAPVLAGTAAVIFLLVGYILKMLKPQPAFADTMLTAGWFFGALTAAAILAAAVGLLITAVRNGATQVVAIDEADEADAPDERTQELARAREAWRHALLERGIYPFLRDALADPSVDPGAPAPRRPMGRMPTLGYDRPGFDSPDQGGSPANHPSFTSPDFTSPDFGGPEHQPD
ncbi:hypothetical protein N4G70_16255 [Streptomyces sp. ASQP_92]|uniref:hypothetical protein n=1 Tax=Streptomyces sp. ASQP_92 TaxID=2979116 RepID=UPI0021C1E074|nr:hypothetical protein [Streptomyces sp. ASQP_92]MCT9090407.1 hypothetical protein [Streptomyces sp. ASQP_92]